MSEPGRKGTMSVVASIVTPDAMLGVCPPEPSDPPPQEDSKLVVAKTVRALLKGLPSPVKCGAEVISAIDDNSGTSSWKPLPGLKRTAERP